MRDLQEAGVYFLVFSSQEERDRHIKTERELAFRAHRARLDTLRSAYMASLQTEPAFGDSAHHNYMRGIKEEFEAFFAENARIANNQKYYILESDITTA